MKVLVEALKNRRYDITKKKGSKGSKGSKGKKESM